MKILKYILGISLLLPTFAFSQTAPLDISKGITVKQMNEAFSSKIDTNRIGVANGVSGLNGNSEAIAPINTTGTVATTGKTYAGQVPAQYFVQTHLTLPATNQLSVGDNLGYNILDNRSVMLGGRRYGGHSPTFVYASPYGGSGLGVAFTVGMTKAGVGGAQPAIAPFGTPALSSYPEFDAAATWFFADTSYPWVSAGADITSNDGISRTVTYDATHAYFDPALSQQDISLLRVGMHVMTNSVGSSRSNNAGYWQPINDYAGEITAIASDGSSITVGGWRVLGAGNTDPTQVPGTTYDTTYWPTYTHSAIFMGTYTHQVVTNRMCFLEARTVQTSGDTNSPETGVFPNPSNDCEIEEADLSSRLPDYMGRSTGYVVNYTGPNKPAKDSVAFEAVGGMPNGFVAWLGTMANDILSDGFYVHGNNGVNSGYDNTNKVVTGTAGDTHELAEIMGASAVQPNGGGSGDKLSLAAWESLINNQANMGENPGSNTAIHWGYLINGTDTEVSTLTGGEKIKPERVTSEVVFNPTGTGDIALHVANTQLGMRLTSDASAKFDGSVYIPAGHTLYFPTSGNQYGTHFTVDDNGNLTLSSDVSGGGVLYTGAGLKVASMAYAQLPTSPLDWQEVNCTNCYSSLNPNKDLGIRVVYHDGAWRDFLGAVATHN